MATPEGNRLAQSIRLKMTEIRSLCEDLDDEAASRSPSGRWSPKQIISHLSGPEGKSFIQTINLLLEHENPRLDIEAGNDFFTENRSRMTIKKLLAECEREIDQIADRVATLSEAQLGKKIHVLLLKDSPIGEYPTLAELIGAMGEWHMDFHIKHMKEILQELGAA
jgi:hypothetical protein